MLKPRKNMRFIVRHQLFLLTFFMISSWAAPPFFTDDADPADKYQLQIYFFSSVNSAAHNTFLSAPGLELDYGLFNNFEIHVIPQVSTFFPSQGRAEIGYGDTETGIKYRFLTENAHRPEIALAPIAELPTGNAKRGLGNGRIWYKLPLWIEKHWGPWTTYGGGGYGFNSAPLTKNFLYGGWLLQRQLTDNLILGGEIFSQGSTATTHQTPFQDSSATTLVNVGGYYQFKQLTLVFSGGHSFIGPNQWVGYLGLYVAI